MCAVDIHVSVLVHPFPLDRNYCYRLVIYDTLVSLQVPAIIVCFDRLQCKVLCQLLRPGGSVMFDKQGFTYCTRLQRARTVLLRRLPAFPPRKNSEK